MNETTTIQVRKQTRDLLKKTGSKDDTYDDIILELIDMREAFISELNRRIEEIEENPEDVVTGTLGDMLEHEGLE